MKVLLLHIFLLGLLPASFAQSNCAVKKAYAYYNVSMPGAQRVDENGNAVDPKPIITRFIYVEYNGAKAPEIRSVTYNNTALDYRVIVIREKTVYAGEKQFNPRNSITAKKGNSFLRVDLQPFEGKTMPAVDCKKITIKTISAGKTCTLSLQNEKKFAAPPNY